MSSAESVQIPSIPRSIEEFAAMRDRIAQTPQGGACVMAVALLLYADDPALGRQALTMSIDRDRLETGPGGYKGWQVRAADMRLIRRQVEGKAYLPRSYIQGTAPEQGYSLPEPPYTFAFQDNPYSGDPDSGTYKTFIWSSGAASARPIALKRNNRGFWKAAEWSSLIVGVTPPAAAVDDDL